MPAGTPDSKDFQLQRNSIVAFKKPRKWNDEQFDQFVDQAANDILNRFGMSVITVGVESYAQLRVLPEADMNKQGWFRADQIFMLKKDIVMPKEEAIDINEISEWTPEIIEKLVKWEGDTMRKILTDAFLGEENGEEE